MDTKLYKKNYFSFFTKTFFFQKNEKKLQITQKITKEQSFPLRKSRANYEKLVLVSFKISVFTPSKSETSFSSIASHGGLKNKIKAKKEEKRLNLAGI